MQNNNQLFYSPGSLHEPDDDEQQKKKERLRLARARIGERPWLPLDNASKIFLSTMTSIDTKVFRLSAGLAEDVRPELLQQALDQAYDAFPLYHSTIRRGFFWYFVERSDARPHIAEEKDIPCAQIYRSTYRGLLFRVLYRANRIHLEVFHALSDGNGAISFFQLLLMYYLQACHSADHRPGAHIVPYFDPSASREDSFAENFFAKKNKNKSPAPASGGPAAASASAAASAESASSAPETAAKKHGVPADAQARKPHRPARVYHIKGENTADGRMNILEIHLRTSHLLARARAAGATLTSYLCAVFMLAIAKNIPSRRQQKPNRIVLSVPVDLRQYFPSLTSRNFFATIMLEHTFANELWPSPAELAAVLTKQLKERSQKHLIEKKVRGLVRLEQLLPVRLVPLYLKDIILRLANSVNNLGITASMTNLGRFRLPADIGGDVQEMNVMTSAVRPQFSMMSYEKDCSIVFTSPKRSAEIEESFCRILEEEGLAINFAVKADPPPARSDRRRARRLKDEKEAARILNSGAGQITVSKDKRRSAKIAPYPFVPLSLDLKRAKQLVTLGSAVILLLAVLGNRLWHWGLPWTLPMLACVTLWAVVTGILRNRHNVAWSVLQQSMFLSALVCLIDLFIGWQGWSISLALPIIYTCSLAATHIALLVSRRALENGLLFMFASAALALLPLLFLILGIVHPLWPSIVVVVLAALSVTLVGILRRRSVREEWGRNWHL